MSINTRHGSYWVWGTLLGALLGTTSAQAQLKLFGYEVSVSAPRLPGLPALPNCFHRDCPAPYKYTQEGPPKLRTHYGCPKPVCDLHHLEHFGYFEPCWRPWPYPPDWRHCPTPVPAAFVPPAGAHFYTPQMMAPQQSAPVDPQSLPQPRQYNGPLPKL